VADKNLSIKIEWSEWVDHIADLTNGVRGTGQWPDPYLHYRVI